MLPCAHQIVILCSSGLVALAGPPTLQPYQQASFAGDSQASGLIEVVSPVTISPQLVEKSDAVEKQSPAETKSDTLPVAEVSSDTRAAQKSGAPTEDFGFILPKTLKTINDSASSLPRAADASASGVEGETLSETPKHADFTPIIGTANRVTVASIGIDIAIKPGEYDTVTNAWKVDDSAAFHADTTVPVNNSNGTTLLYGHAIWGIFGNLPDIADGAEAVVFTDEGRRFIYAFESLSQVSPSDVSMLTTEGRPTLLLQTCSGFFDQHRTLARFSLKEVRGD